MEREIRMNFNDVENEEKIEKKLTDDVRSHLFRMLPYSGWE